MPDNDDIKPIDSAELKKLSEDAMKASAALQTKLDENGANIDKKFEEFDVLVKDSTAKMVEEVNKAVEASSQHAREAKAAAAVMERMGKGDGKAESENEVIANYRKHVASYFIKGNSVAPALDSFVAENKEEIVKGIFDNETMQKKALDSISNPNGGYLMPQAMQRIVDARVFETSPMRQYAETIPLAEGDTAEFIIDNDEADFGWTGETQARPETGTPELDLIEIVTQELYAQPKVTQKLLDRAAVDIEAWIGRKIGTRLARGENTAFVNGDGVKKPKGFLQYGTTAAAAYSATQLQLLASGVSADVTYDGFVKLQSALKEDYQADAVFAYNRQLNLQVYTIRDGNDRPILNLDYDKNAGLRHTILGKEVTFFNDMPVAGAGSKSVAYGDFGEAYKIIDGQGLSVLRDPYTSKPFVKFYATKNTGGGVVNFEALKLLSLNT